MNDHIDELMILAGARFEFLHGVNYDDFQYREFARLIVRETLNEMGEQMDKFGDEQSNNPTWYKAMEAVEKHFGIQE